MRGGTGSVAGLRGLPGLGERRAWRCCRGWVAFPAHRCQRCTHRVMERTGPPETGATVMSEQPTAALRAAIVTGDPGASTARASSGRHPTDSRSSSTTWATGPRPSRAVAAINATGGRAIAFRADVADEVAVSALFDTAEESCGGVDVVVMPTGSPKRRGTPPSEVWTCATIERPSRPLRPLATVSRRSSGPRPPAFGPPARVRHPPVLRSASTSKSPENAAAIRR